MTIKEVELAGAGRQKLKDIYIYMSYIYIYVLTHLLGNYSESKPET